MKKINGLEKKLEQAMHYHQLGQLEMANRRYEDILREDGNHANALHLKGVIAFQQGRFNKSAELIFKAIKEDGNQAAFYNNLGNTLGALGKPKRALACFNKAVEIDPTLSDAIFNLANAYHGQGDFNDAIELYHRAINLNPESAHIYNNLGTAYDEKGLVEKAIHAYRTAIKIDPQCIDAYNNLCALQEGASLLEDAHKTARTAIEIDPNSDFAVYNLSQVFYRLQRYNEAERLLKRHLEKDLPVSYYSRFCFLLGKINNRLHRYDDAFGFFTRANQSVLNSDALTGYRKRRSQTLGEIDGTRHFFSVPRIHRWRFTPPTKANIKLAFLVGFPRSGTTLLEQILSTRDNVATLDEQPIFEDVFRPYRLPEGGLERLDHLSADEIDRHRQDYLNRALKKIKPPDAFGLIIDKLPLNILYLGVIYRFFPDAKVIVALRHPLGCVLSGFMQQFKMNKMMFNFLSIEGCAKFYATVMRLYLHYRQVLPLPMHQIRYEDVVDNLEYEIRQLFDFLGLEWQESALDFHQTAKNRKITTPSYSQVVKPIYQDAVNRWRKYETHLAPAKEWVEPFIRSFGYAQRSDHLSRNVS